MNDTELRLAQLLDDAAPTPPRSLSGPAIRDHARPTRRHLLVPVAAALVVLALAATAGVIAASRQSASSRPATPPATDVVAWNPAGQQPTTTLLSSPTPIGAPTGTPGCTGADFAVVSHSTRPSDSNPGWLTTQFTLRSTSRSACSVGAAELGVGLVDAGGRALPNDGLVPDSPVARFPSRLLVSPGQVVRSEVDWFWTVGATARPAAIDIYPNFGVDSSRRGSVSISVVDVAMPTPSATRIGALRDIDPWRAGWTSAVPWVSNDDPFEALTAKISAPDTVRAGTVLRYTVALANGSDDAISLKRCPTVIQTVNVVLGKTPITNGTRGPLNCGAAGQLIPAHTTVTFHFELDTSGLPAGEGWLQWQLVDGATVVINSDRSELSITP